MSQKQNSHTKRHFKVACMVISITILNPYKISAADIEVDKNIIDVLGNNIMSKVEIVPEDKYADSVIKNAGTNNKQKQNNKEEDDEKEFQDRCRMTFAESGLEEIEGQIAVAAVIINRQQSTEFPETFEDVINQDAQFASVVDGEIYIKCQEPYVLDYKDVPEETIKATQRALEGEDPTEELLWARAIELGLDPEIYAAGGALYFYNPNACTDEALAARANIPCTVKIGNHVFYKVRE